MIEPRKYCVRNPKDRQVVGVGITFERLTLHIKINLLVYFLPNFTSFAISIDTFSLLGIADISEYIIQSRRGSTGSSGIA